MVSIWESDSEETNDANEGLLQAGAGEAAGETEPQIVLSVSNEVSKSTQSAALLRS